VAACIGADFVVVARGVSLVNSINGINMKLINAAYQYNNGNQSMLNIQMWCDLHDGTGGKQVGS
jgi:hypothetical protein